MRHLSLVLRWSRSMTRKGTRPLDYGSVLDIHLVLKLEDQDQTQDGDEV